MQRISGSKEHTTEPEGVSAACFEQSVGLCLRWVFPQYLPPIPITDQRILCGRGEDCGRGRIDGREVSRHHAELGWRGSELMLRDLGAKNGTFLNGARVMDAPVEEGDVLRCGDHVGVVTGLPAPDQEGPGWFGELAPGLLGGPELRALLAPVRRAARTDLPIVIEGATGTGKDEVAQAIHAWSGRQGRFHALNCASLAPSLVEAELFGYSRGAFTGATQAHPGQLRAADHGTLFLDEVVDLPLPLQPKLLRALQEQEVLPLGQSRPVRFDARILAGAQAPLGDAVAHGRFRGDLHARLDGLTVRLPTLFERISDVPGLLVHFLRQAGGGQAPVIEARLIEALCLHDWPYNVRELERVAQQLMVLHGHEPLLKASHLHERFRPREDEQVAQGAPGLPSRGVNGASARERRERERQELLTAIELYAGNLAEACRSIGIQRRRAYRLLTDDFPRLEAIRSRFRDEARADAELHRPACGDDGGEHCT
ncbi:MAG TPA: sigma 54-interacting transcriptional regulator [Polyangiaceae bacterium]|nr:sigma 54-interacting transcriptional regulator [Polyangiaceae bacterium]